MLHVYYVYCTHVLVTVFNIKNSINSTRVVAHCTLAPPDSHCMYIHDMYHVCPLVGRRTIRAYSKAVSTTTRPPHPRRFHAMLLVFETSVRPCFETISRHCSPIFLLVGANVPFHFATVVCTTMVKQYDGAVR